MVVACVALLVALGGTSVAAVSQLARNSVGPAQLQFGAVTNPKIRSNAVTSAKVRNRSLLRADFAPGQLPAGPTGPQGPAGPAGPAGAAGPAGVIGAITVRTNSVSIVDVTANNGAFNSGRVERRCEANERAISGGTSWGDDGVEPQARDPGARAALQPAEPARTASSPSAATTPVSRATSPCTSSASPAS